MSDEAVKYRDWQPISTAPRDGTRILGWSLEYGQRETFMGKYRKGSIGYNAWQSGDGPLNIGWDWLEPISGWWGTWKPTHWLPIQTPPDGE